ncbi:MAG: glycosyltransferase family 2 protein, partial [Cytophagales bacterium]|nr:glycosyltransferase family 2 protein [Cytophagales bacterium]
MLKDITVPHWVKELSKYSTLASLDANAKEQLKLDLKKFHTDTPKVSVILPAYNEEENIVRTLASFAKMNLKYPTELLVINNNSTDRTQEILDELGVKSFLQPLQGATFARQMGLDNAKGEIFVNGDGDSIYPPQWVNEYADQLLNDSSLTCVYGTYSFLPVYHSRFYLWLYELFAFGVIKMRRNIKQEYLNVLGFNFAFRTQDGKKVGGFNITRKFWQDGWMAMMLMEHGKLKQITGFNAHVWTS